MASRRNQPEPKREDQPGPSLRHNPFAALKGASAGSSLENAAPTPVHEPEREKRARSDGEKSPKPVVRASIVVRREKKGHGGKAVTIAEGAGLAGHDLDEMARELAKGLGAGARALDGALVVQGEQTDRLVAWLEKKGFGGIVRGN